MKAGQFGKLKLKQYAKVQDRETSEAKYWKSFSTTSEDKLQSSPSCIHFMPNSNSSYIVTGSIKVSLYDSLTDKLVRAYSRFNDDAFSGRFRNDGKLIVAGDKTGIVKVFDVQSKAVLRQMKRHNAAVRCTTWAHDSVHIYSGSDDKKAFKWDLATEEVVWSSKSNHSDYIRALDASPVSSDIFITGSYDHSVKLWDCRQEAAAMKVTLDKPVEYCMFTPSGTMMLTASGSEVRIYDVLSGGRLLHTFNNHQKNVTCLAMDGTHSRLLSTGLDGHLKVYNLQSLQVAHGMKFGSPLVSLAISQDNKKLLVGFVNGTLIARNRRTDAHSRGNISGVTSGGGAVMAPAGIASAQFQSGLGSMSVLGGSAGGGGADTAAGSTFSLLESDASAAAEIIQQNRFFKGAGMAHMYADIYTAGSTTQSGGGNSSSSGSSSSGAAGADGSLSTERVARLQPYEKHLKKFNYQAALDAVLRSRNPVAVVTVLEELCRRDGLSAALAGRDELTLEPLVSFCARYVNHPKYAKLIVMVVQRVLDLYAEVLGQSDAIDELFLKLHKQVRAEVGFQRQILRVMGSLDGLVSAATMPRK